MTEIVAVRSSPVHGQGVFACTDLDAGQHVGFYDGEVITAEEADRRHADNGYPEHTMLFGRSDGMVIDGSSGGNATRFINHGCDPNCQAEEYDDGTIGVVTTAPVAAGAELFLDYQLVVDADDADNHPCRCGAPTCRGTMVAG